MLPQNQRGSLYILLEFELQNELKKKTTREEGVVDLTPSPSPKGEGDRSARRMTVGGYYADN